MNIAHFLLILKMNINTNDEHCLFSAHFDIVERKSNKGLYNMRI